MDGSKAEHAMEFFPVQPLTRLVEQGIIPPLAEEVPVGQAEHVLLTSLNHYYKSFGH